MREHLEGLFVVYKVAMVDKCCLFGDLKVEFKGEDVENVGLIMGH